MTAHDKSSADIARNTADAMRDDAAEFSGLPRKHPSPQDAAPSPGVIAWVLGMAALVALVLIAAFAMPATPAPYVGPGFENCQGRC
jgi:hypothetical protein